MWHAGVAMQCDVRHDVQLSVPCLLRRCALGVVVLRILHVFEVLGVFQVLAVL